MIVMRGDEGGKQDQDPPGGHAAHLCNRIERERVLGLPASDTWIASTVLAEITGLDPRHLRNLRWKHNKGICPH